jgi:hypothetical protein
VNLLELVDELVALDARVVHRFATTTRAIRTTSS